MNVYETVKSRLNLLCGKIETHYSADCLLFHGQISPLRLPLFGHVIKGLSPHKTRLVVVLQTLGGSAETTEKFVEIIRNFYNEVYFIVPRYAMSAGTIFCMSGDKIIMDFESSLGPIDPQIYNGKDFVPAQGYLDYYENLIKKSQEGTISPGEFQKLILTDLADISRFEQAKNLTETLLKKWLVQYKFKDWNTHRHNEAKRGQPVTYGEKVERAAQIAEKLGNNAIWHSHGRYLSPTVLKDELRLEIDDYPSDAIKNCILEYNDTAEEHMSSKGYYMFFHSKNFF